MYKLFTYNINYNISNKNYLKSKAKNKKFK